MSAKVSISSANKRRINRAQIWLEGRAAAEEVLIVGATLDAANELARKGLKKGGAFGWQRFTLPQLTFAVAAPVLAARGLTPLSRIGAYALAARLVHRMNAESRLVHYQSIAATPGFPPAVARVIGELRLARLPSEAVARFAPDLGRIMEAFEVELEEAGLTDWPGVLALASETAGAFHGERHRVVGLPMLLLDVPIRSEAEIVFVHSLVSAATDFFATVPAADQATIDQLRDRLRVEIENLDLEPSCGESEAYLADAAPL